MLEYLIIGIVSVVFFTIGLFAGKALFKPKTSGTLIIDKTGDADIWTFALDDALDNVEKSKVINLNVDKRE